MTLVFDGTNRTFNDRLTSIEGAVNVNGANANNAQVTATGSTTARPEKDRWADVVNVKDFGAKGDGTTDDTAALNAARDAAYTTGAEIFVPPGIYSTTGLVLKQGQRIRGSNWAGNSSGWYLASAGTASVFRARTAITNVLEVDGDANGYINTTEISYLGIWGLYGSGAIPSSAASTYTAWAQSTVYQIGDRRSTTRGDVYECITGGQSAGSGTGPMGFAIDITDNAAHWKFVGVGNGIYVHGSSGTGGNSGCHIHHVTIAGVQGRGIHMTAQWFVKIGDMVHVDACSENGIELSGGINTTLDTTYVHRVAAGRAGYRVHGGWATLLNVNGIDASGSGASWGIFGDVTADDGASRSFQGAIFGFNVESFPDKGMWFKYGSMGKLTAGSFIGDQPNAVALQLDYPGEGMTLDPTVTFQTSGSWANGYAIHIANTPPIMFGHITGTWTSDTLGNQCWNDTSGLVTSLPTIDIQGKQLHLTPLSIVNAGDLTTPNYAISQIVTHYARTFTGVTWTASPVADGATTSADITFPGATNAQRFTAYYQDQYVPAGVIIQASCSSAGHVAVTIYNKTGGNYTPPTGTLYVETWSH